MQKLTDKILNVMKLKYSYYTTNYYKKRIKIYSNNTVLADAFVCVEKEENGIKPCNIQTKHNASADRHNFEIKMVEKAPEISLFLTYNKESDSVSIRHKWGEEGGMNSVQSICKFPEYAKAWTIPDEGLTVILNGKGYEYPEACIEICSSLELTPIEK